MNRTAAKTKSARRQRPGAELRKPKTGRRGRRASAEEPKVLSRPANDTGLGVDLPEPEAAFNPAIEAPFEAPMEDIPAELETLAGGDDAGEADDVEPELEASAEEAPDGDDDEDGESDEEEAVETSAVPDAKKVEEPQSFLSMYFRDMAELDVLRPEQEFETARHIEDLELDLWRAVLGFVPWAAHVADTVEAAVGQPVAEFKPYRLQAERTGTRPSAALRKKFEKLVDALAARLKELDIDRVFVDAALAEMHRLDGAARMGRPVEGLAFPTNTKAFRAFVHATTGRAGIVKRAKNEFVKANLRLVVSIARRFNHGRLPLPDLIQEGNIGLMKAVERYDYRRGFRFSTYASWWIRHAISRALADKGRAVRLPVHMIDAYHRIAKSERELQSKLERPATTEEIASVTGIEAEKLEKMRTFLADNPVSLDRSLSDDDGRRLIDVLVDPNEAPSPPEQMMSSETQREMLKLLGGLKPIEADILRKRFGLVNDRERTLKEIGDEYRLSRERVRQLQEQALGKMRKAMAKREML